MAHGSTVAYILDTGSMYEGTSLCSSFVQAGWAEDTSAEQQLSASAADASSQSAEQEAAEVAAQQAQEQASNDQHDEQSAIATLASDSNFSSDLTTLSGDATQTDSDLGQTREDAKAGGGDNCVHASSTVYNDAASTVFNDAQSALYDHLNTLTPDVQTMQKDIGDVQAAD